MFIVYLSVVVFFDDVLYGIFYCKVMLCFIIFFCLCYFVVYFDCINIGFVKFQMFDVLKFSDIVYGFGVGLFFVGYILFEVLSNLVL